MVIWFSFCFVISPPMQIITCNFFAATVKQLCEIELGLVSQCCLSDHVRNGKRDYIANLLLKINAKVGMSLTYFCLITSYIISSWWFIWEKWNRSWVDAMLSWKMRERESYRWFLTSLQSSLEQMFLTPELVMIVALPSVLWACSYCFFKCYVYYSTRFHLERNNRLQPAWIGHIFLNTRPLFKHKISRGVKSVKDCFGRKKMRREWSRVVGLWSNSLY